MRALLTIFLCFFAGVSSAEEAVVGQHLDIELNAASQTNDGCQLSFVLINGHPEDIQQAVFETVLFDMGGAVIRLTLFDMGALPAARPRVRQFVLPQTQCSDMGQILFNGTTSCTTETLANTACMAGLSLRSRTDIEVLG